MERMFCDADVFKDNINSGKAYLHYTNKRIRLIIIGERMNEIDLKGGHVDVRLMIFI